MARMTRKGKPPREKKDLSLAKDRPSLHQRSNKGSRAGIPRLKRKINESYRRKAKEKVKGGLLDSGEGVEDGLAGIRRDKWWKDAPKSLGEVIEGKKRRRIENHGARKSRKASSDARAKALEAILLAVRRDKRYKTATEEKILNVAHSLLLEKMRKQGGG